MSLNITFLGFGEAAFAIASGLLRESKNINITAYDVNLSHPIHGKIMRERAESCGVVLQQELPQAISGSDYIFSMVVSAAAEAVAQNASPFLSAEHVYVDFNSTSPDIKQKVARIVTSRGAKFVESAIMAAVPPLGHKVPMLICGEAGKDFCDKMSRFSMQAKFVSEEIGKASAIKMCRSIIVKGLEALLLESLVSSNEYGITEDVFDSLQESFPYADFRKLANHLIPRTAIHAQRRSYEMKEAAAMVEEVGLEPFMCNAASERLTWLSGFGLKDQFKGVAPKGYSSVLEAMQNKHTEGEG